MNQANPLLRVAKNFKNGAGSLQTKPGSIISGKRIADEATIVTGSLPNFAECSLIPGIGWFFFTLHSHFLNL